MPNVSVHDAAKPRRGRGRPRKVVENTRQEYVIDDEAAAAEIKAAEGAPDEETAFTGNFLFDSLATTRVKDITKVRVTRTEPDEGYLGVLDPQDANEAGLVSKWGGGKFLLQGLNHKNQIVRALSVKVGGDPIFVSTEAETKWRRQFNVNGILKGGGQHGQAPDVLSMIEEREAKREAERERQRREDRERDREHKEALAKIATEAEARRRDDERAREERARQDAARAAEQSREHMQTMIQLVQAASNNSVAFMKMQLDQQAQAASKIATADPATMMMKGIELFQTIKEAAGGDGGDSEKTPMQMLMANLPQLLGSAVDAAKGIVADVRRTPGQPAPQQLPAGGGLTLPPSLQPKVEKLVTKLASEGHNPEAVLHAVIDKLLVTPSGPRSAGPSAPTAPVPGSDLPKNPVNVHPQDVPQAVRTHPPADVPMQPVAVSSQTIRISVADVPRRERAAVATP